MKLTKLHQQAIQLQHKLRPLSPAQRRYAHTLFDNKALYTKHGIVRCQHCGHMQKKNKEELALDSATSYHCPCCGSYLELAPTGQARQTVQRKWFIIAKAVGDWQVFRVFESCQTAKINKATEYSINEIFQTWLTPLGKSITLSRSYSRSFNNLSWHYNTPINRPRSRRPILYNDYIFDLSNTYIYPRSHVTKILERNGWRNEFFDGTLSVEEIAKHLYIPTFEMIAKTQPKLFKMLVLREVYDFPFAHAVKICNRNKYNISDPDVWYDMVRNVNALGLDTHSPHYICPTDLQSAHEKILKRIFKHRQRIQHEERKQQTEREEQAYAKTKSRYFNINISDETIRCNVLNSVQAFLEEGEAMHHCVFSNKYYQLEDSLILSARSSTGERLETIEINLKNYTIAQCRGKHNQPTPYHDHIIQLVNQNMNLIKQAKQ